MTTRLLLTFLTALLVLAPSASAAGRLDALAGGPMHLGIFSPNGQAARERAQASLDMRYLYLTGGVGDGTRTAPGSGAAHGIGEWLRESAATHMTPVLTYYQLQPSARRGHDEVTRVASVLRDRKIMRAYWRDVRGAMKVMGADRNQLVIFHVEPDGWQFLEQLQGVRTKVRTRSTGVRELRGLPEDARGYARAFVRLRDRYAPNVALGWHLSAWGTGQVNPASVANSTHIAQVRSSFYKSLGATFDLAVHDPGGNGIDAASFAENIALLKTFHDATGLPLLLWQIQTGTRVPWFLAGTPAAQGHLAAERAAGVLGMLWDGGLPEHPDHRREQLLDLAGAAAARGLLG